jgi:hypothetical protein
MKRAGTFLEGISLSFGRGEVMRFGTFQLKAYVAAGAENCPTLFVDLRQNSRITGG